MTNAFKKREQALATIPTGTASPEAMIASCWRLNCWAKKIGWDRWYYVTDNNGSLHFATKEGDDVRMMWAMMDGKRPEYQNWSEEKNRKEYFQLRKLVQQGMDADEFRLTRMA